MQFGILFTPTTHHYFCRTTDKDIWVDIDVYDLFDVRQIQLRQERQIFTGNILRAYEAFEGKLVNFTDHQGKIRQGVLTPQDFDIEKKLEQVPVRLASSEDVKQFINETTQRTGSVKTFDELLTIKAEKKGDGFVLQAPKARDTGGQYYLDSDILTATGADFYSVGERMECIVPPERIDRVLEVVTKDKGLSLAAFDQRLKAREMLGIELPKLQHFEPRQFEPQVSKQPLGEKVAETRTITDATTHQVKEDLTRQRVEVSDAALKDGLSVGERSQAEELESSQPLEITSAILPQQEKIFSIADHHFQVGVVEKNVAKLLHQAGLADSILKESDFYLKVENDPYIPLSIERHGQEMYLTHLLADSYGDLFIDCEMVFDVSDNGQLTLTQTAVQNPFAGGESRRNDREFGEIFSQNLLKQGFAEAVVRLQVRQQSSAPLQSESPLVTFPDVVKEASQKLAEAFDGVAVENFARVEPPIAEPEQLVSISSATQSEYPEPSKPLVIQETQLSLFDLGLNNINEHTQPNPPLPTVLPQASSQTSVETPAPQPVVQALTQNSASPPLKDIPVVDLEITQPPVAKPGLSSNIQQPESAFNQDIASAHAQHPVAEHSESLSERASQVRDIDLETVAIELGLERDRHDKHKWHGSGQIISINGGKFYDHLNQKGSGGAIDLVMHVQECDYKQAVEWLSEQPTTPQVRSDRPPVRIQEPVAKDEPKYLALPMKDETKWSDVQKYLIETRGLPESLINNAHQLGLVYADPQRNAVFLRHTQDAWERGEINGASLRGTWGEFHGLSPGSDKEKGWFWFGLGKGEV